MDNLFDDFQSEHPPYEQFLLFVDGELAPKEAAKWNAHLDACWSCRVRARKIQETIADIIEFEETVSPFQAPPDSRRWVNFDSRLNNLAQEIRQGSKLWGYWKQFENFWAFNWSGKLAVSSLVVLLIFALLYQFVFVQGVSAGELLEKSVAAQTEKIGATNQAVVYQKLQVKRGNAPAAELEIWQDTTRPRFRQLINHSNTAGKSENDVFDVLGNLPDILRSNGLNPQQPLSPVTFQKWRASLAEKTDEVNYGQNENGVKFLSLRTTDNLAANTGQIIESVLNVRESDWHPVSQTWLVKTVSGEEIYELIELDFRIESLTAFQPDFFDDQTAPEIEVVVETPKTISSPAANASPSLSPGVASSPIENVKTEVAPNVPKAVATADLEVDVLRLLNQAKADLGEQITVGREADNLLYVRGIVETPSRKNEILSALDSVKDNSAVRIEISTVDEAIAKEKNKPQTPVKTESVETQSSSIAAENDLIEYFGSQEAARAFAGQMVNRSGRAMSRAYALKRLIGQFKPEELRELSPTARAKWLALVNSHARAFHEETEALRRELQTVFSAPNAGASETPDVKTIADVPRAVETLLNLAIANDRVVRSAMAVSAGNSQFTAIKTVQFWQSLKAAEALAAKLQAIK